MELFGYINLSLVAVFWICDIVRSMREKDIAYLIFHAVILIAIVACFYDPAGFIKGANFGIAMAGGYPYTP
ncbi:TPA: hypothetical protein DIV45_02600 [Patescibacteria group bacterium]|uniref:Uncharacterized protein n=2 Tax=Bacteria division Kazan-3B-28 TaxID=1798534 RepID=A0A0G1NRD0_UNCK3|nr:MAG: hypothetical protein VE96_C0007G0005 [candidate division Kazan bacterium GW2011_GWA1_44_22]KKT86754.1 MAG: hypothetical protein VE97_C0019G0007 [candidate division Kazan bacterium GW2011_GWB1_45_10]HCR42225.1 hypothetical protein [Patescibacteria group bacterium]